MSQKKEISQDEIEEMQEPSVLNTPLDGEKKVLNLKINARIDSQNQHSDLTVAEEEEEKEESA